MYTTIHAIVEVKYDEGNVMATLQLECGHIAYEVIGRNIGWTIGERYYCEQVQYHADHDL